VISPTPRRPVRSGRRRAETGERRDGRRRETREVRRKLLQAGACGGGGRTRVTRHETRVKTRRARHGLARDNRQSNEFRKYSLLTTHYRTVPSSGPLHGCSL
jgi:hypothetical protein